MVVAVVGPRVPSLPEQTLVWAPSGVALAGAGRGTTGRRGDRTRCLPDSGGTAQPCGGDWRRHRTNTRVAGWRLADRTGGVAPPSNAAPTSPVLTAALLTSARPERRDARRRRAPPASPGQTGVAGGEPHDGGDHGNTGPRPVGTPSTAGLSRRRQDRRPPERGMQAWTSQAREGWACWS
jgi:hypothetical protein